MNFKKKVIVAMSGGVDSSIAAWLLKKQNYNVEGLFMKNWEENDTNEYCASKKNLKDVQLVCNQLNIYLHKVNFSYEYWNKVFKVFLKNYMQGFTPNPDVLCNYKIKFNVLLKFAIKILKADYLATGHYAINSNFHKRELLKSWDKSKDQTYFLYTLNYKIIKKIIFPLGELNKNIVRKLAHKLNMQIANKKSSTGICFIEPKNFKKFLTDYIPIKKGLIKTIFGLNIGFHDGVEFYTIGQRKGINIGGIKNTSNKPWFVIDKNVSKNILIVAQGSNNIYLRSYGFIIKKPYWFDLKVLKKKKKCDVQIRYRKKSLKCIIYPIKKKYIKIFFKNYEIAVTVGQSAVFYKYNICIGGGIITKVFLINNINKIGS
ncbi:tRNA 2-thiouridine(34) synthase MnmA [Buchnera aphidicola (Mollitrichosiphum nigrofasciatum)]|uniref:tRNA 2-thiouridine(34) synthase MnmA n=1 Tax=Buchnera aphidicola TaxID=9 RepID=UPI0031B8B021